MSKDQPTNDREQMVKRAPTPPSRPSPTKKTTAGQNPPKTNPGERKP
ncbi:MAG TPA: hypothetical protein VGK16_05525 [Candidatus Limnocylindrales bacterium]